jgi:hypothetical protein
MGFTKENQMGKKTALRRPIVALFVFVGMAIAASSASAKTEDIIAPSDPHNGQVDSGWQAGTCKEEPPESAQLCSIATSNQFFETAAGHPKWGFTQFIVKHTTVGLLETPVGEIATVRVDLPVGLSTNPGATERCPLATFQAGASGCPSGTSGKVGEGSIVGESLVTTSLAGVVTPPTKPLTRVLVYNVIPPPGESARFGLELGGQEVFLRGDVAWDGDYHEGFTIDVPKTLPIGGLVLKNRLVFEGTSGDGTFITTPSTCLGEAFTESGSIYSTMLLVQSWKEKEEEEADAGYVFPQSAEPAFESPIPPGTSPKECDTIPYAPSSEFDPKTEATDSPAGARTHIVMPFVTGGTTQETSDTKRGAFTLPLGMSLNPSAATGLAACTDEQFGKGTKAPVACPAASKVGTVKIESPPLPEGALEGNVYVGSQLSRDPASGEEYRIFVDAESARYGISVRLVGHVHADPATAQLTAVFDELPQVPFTSFVIQLDEGPRATLTSPQVCGVHSEKSDFTPWSGNADAEPGDEFTLNSSPAGGCPATLAERPFTPKFSAATSSPQAGAFTDVSVNVTREPGNQEIKGTEVKLPPGLTAKLAGVRYCPEEAIAAAAANSGVAEAASPSCPVDSLVGTASITSGSGPEPLHIETGKAFLSGPYHGAPLSLAVITPATAGPFDLGTVVVRVALLLDPKTARVTAVTDPIPHIYGGSLLDVRSISVKMDRPQFGLNPTNCSAFAFEGTLKGGGGNPADPAAFTSLPFSSPFQASGCEKLGFKPRLFLRAFGGTKRTQKPKLRAILVARPGDANISRAVVTLPKALILEQANIGTVCTRVQFAAKECPANSVYGFAEATTPLLDGPLKGPVYLRSNPEHELPDLVTALHGQVDVELTGVTDTTKQGRLRNTFEAVPDVPVSKFVLTVRGGKKGLLVNTRDICRHKQFSRLELTGQNGAQLVKKKLRVRTPCKGKKRHHRGHGAG